MIRVVINGACGRMGRRLVALISEDAELELAGALEFAEHPLLNEDAGIVAGVKALGVRVASGEAPDADVLIDFSSPVSTVARVKACAEKGMACVVGTTGLTDAQSAVIREASERVPCLHAPNMSVGVNTMFYLAETAARILGDSYDVEIIEAHHHYKKDAPSGTALRLLERVSKALDRDPNAVAVHGREGQVGERSQKEIGMHAVRAGDIVGDHTLLFCNEGERIELIHRAHTRDTFARGALRAAKFVVTQPPGLYDMADALGLPKT